MLRPGPYTLGFSERWFLQTMEQPPRRRIRSGNSFIAAPNLDQSATLRRMSRCTIAFAHAFAPTTEST
jgi:hypothetical protein